MEYLVLLGIAVVIVGFALRLDAILIVFLAAIVTALLGNLGIDGFLTTLGESFVSNRSVALFIIILLVTGTLERNGLKQAAAELIGKAKGATPGIIIALYGVMRLVFAAFNVSFGGVAGFVRPIIMPMAVGAIEATGHKPDEDYVEQLKGMASGMENVAWFFDAVTWLFNFLIEVLTDVLVDLHPLVIILLLALIGWVLRSWQMAVGTVITMFFIMTMDQWVASMQTLALVLIAAVIAVIIAVPVGILAARNEAASTVIKPILDFMQTMPSFVYLIPAVTFFGIGVVPGLVATVIFALPPGVRFTELGIRGVDSETVEAGQSFGATPGQILRGVQLPLATPTIMAGINQVIMLALAMAVIAGMVGADGLGKNVVEAIATQNLPLGVEAGLGVVIIAVYLDRVTAALGNAKDYPRSLVAGLRRRSAKNKTAAAAA